MVRQQKIYKKNFGNFYPIPILKMNTYTYTYTAGLI